MSHFKKIYSSKADLYQQLVSWEDYQENLPRALSKIRSFEGLDVIDIGAGTGRLTRIVAPAARRVITSDISHHMLSVAQNVLADAGIDDRRIVVADNRQLPLPDHSTDLIMAGWSLGHSIGWYPDSWRCEIGRALDEMSRVTRSGGIMIVIETLGTNLAEPKPPTSGLAEFYAWMEGDLGFSHTWIRTDYRFPSVQVAADSTRFFFGEEMVADVIAHQKTIVPECTGIWWRTVNS